MFQHQTKRRLFNFPRNLNHLRRRLQDHQRSSPRCHPLKAHTHRLKLTNRIAMYRTNRVRPGYRQMNSIGLTRVTRRRQDKHRIRNPQALRKPQLCKNLSCSTRARYWQILSIHTLRKPHHQQPRSQSSFQNKATFKFRRVNKSKSKCSKWSR